MSLQISEVRIRLIGSGNSGLLAVCSVLFDNGLCVRDIKVIKGSKGPFLSMPARRLTDPCPYCRGKNHRKARFCNDCGGKLSWDSREDYFGREQLFSDIVLPTTSNLREYLSSSVIKTYLQEMAHPGSCLPLLVGGEEPHRS